MARSIACMYTIASSTTTYGHKPFLRLTIPAGEAYVIVRTDLSDKEPHRQTGKHRYGDGIREPRWCDGSHNTLQIARGVGSNPTLGTIFPIFRTCHVNMCV